MFNMDYSFLVILIASALYCTGKTLQGRNNSEREPIYNPEKCPKPNQLLYPEDNDKWVCDCGAGFIYYRPEDGCFMSYRQGPCPIKHYLVFDKIKKTSECLENSCDDGFVRFNGNCYELGKPNGPCPPTNEGVQIFDVNATTLEIECMSGTETSLSLFNVQRKCSPGSIRDSNGNCREMY